MSRAPRLPHTVDYLMATHTPLGPPPAWPSATSTGRAARGPAAGRAAPTWVVAAPRRWAAQQPLPIAGRHRRRPPRPAPPSARGAPAVPPPPRPRVVDAHTPAAALPSLTASRTAQRRPARGTTAAAVASSGSLALPPPRRRTRETRDDVPATPRTTPRSSSPTSGGEYYCSLRVRLSTHRTRCCESTVAFSSI